MNVCTPSLITYNIAEEHVFSKPTQRRNSPRPVVPASDVSVSDREFVTPSSAPTRQDKNGYSALSKKDQAWTVVRQYMYHQ